MQFTEKILHCYNCKKNFNYTAEAQEFRSSQGYPNDPTNCPTCRRGRKTGISNHAKDSDDYSSNQQMYPITCTKCGKSSRVYFNPRPGKPIYCGECQMKIKASR
jgi:CxxC-x17-CxxC domain-containing protein